MTLSLNTIKAGKGTAKKRKRVGRGNSAGHGTYSGRGLKGQKSRSGVSNLKRKGMRQTLLRTPKERGFKSAKPKAQVVNIREININFKAKEVIDPTSLLKKGLIDNIKLEVKILGVGKLTKKELVFKGVKMSGTVKEQVEKSNGKIL